jgi:CHASE2 domain-containing sensor protein/class 3 adenylate cyclase
MNPDPNTLKSEIVTVLFVDIVGYSTQTIEQQARMLSFLQRTVKSTKSFQQAEADGELITIPAGDGMALAFTRNPPMSVNCALQVAAAIRSNPVIELRMGIHTGPVARHADINHNTNIVGGGINMAQRVMDCGDAGHILISRAAKEVLEEFGWREFLVDLGDHEAKHGIRIHLYNLCTGNLGNSQLPGKIRNAVEVAQTVEAAQTESLANSPRATKNHHPRRIVVGVVVTIGLTILVTLLEYYGVLASAEGKIMDRFLASNYPRRQSPIFTAEIDDKAYEQCFASESPLAPAKVAQALKMLNDVSGGWGRPLVIGVDLITDSQKYQPIAKDAWNNMVLVAPAKASSSSDSLWDWLAGHPKPPMVQPGKVLGLQNPPGVSWGLPVLGADEDATLRTVYPRLRDAAVSGSGQESLIDSFALAIARKYCSPGARCNLDGAGSEPVRLVYTDTPPARFAFTDLFHCSETGMTEGILFNRFRQLAQNQIVMIGGTFSNARDSYPTPKGDLPGLLINAYAVQAEIDGSFIPGQRRPIAIALDLVIGVGIVLAFWLSDRFQHKLTVAFALSALLVGAAIVLFWLIGKEYLPGFVGIALGTMAHQIIGGIETEQAAS